MYTRVPAEKKNNPSLGGRNTDLLKKPNTTPQPVKKLNVRSTDYRILMQLVLSNPDSITPEEFKLFQSAVGYQQAIRLMEEGKRRKQLQKVGVPVTDESIQPIQTNKQEGEYIPSRNGLPENLRSGLENLSGVSLLDVKVHKNSDKPQEVGALAYSQGTDIYIAPGQEKYLPHEGWHAVQQKQGRVNTTFQLKTGVSVNDDTELEKEADAMGKKAKDDSENGALQSHQTGDLKALIIKGDVIQRGIQEDGIRLELQNTKNPESVEKDEIEPAAYGETSENVKKIQQVLKNMNYWAGKNSDKATGYFGEVTKESLISFQTGYMKLSKQQLHDKKGNYVGCGPMTVKSLNNVYRLLNNSNIPSEVKSSIMGVGRDVENNSAYNWDIKAGVFNGYVKEAQVMLMNLGYKLPKYGADGKWSSRGETYEALLNYQKNCKDTFDGVNKNGTPESKKHVEHFRSVEPTGKLDQWTYGALEKEKGKKAATNFNKSPLKQEVKDSNVTVNDNSWRIDCLNRGWGPLSKEAYVLKVKEERIEKGNNFDWGEVIWGSLTGPDSIASVGTTIASLVSKNMADYAYRNGVITNSSSRKEAYTKMFDVANKADDLRVVSRTLDSGGWKSLSTKIGVGAVIVGGGVNVFEDLTNEHYDDEDKAKAVTVDVVSTAVSVGTVVAIAAFIPGVGWAFAAGVLAGVGISALTELWKDSWIDD